MQWFHSTYCSQMCRNCDRGYEDEECTCFDPPPCDCDVELRFDDRDSDAVRFSALAPRPSKEGT